MDATVGAMVEAAAGYAFKIFDDKKFRELARFRKLSQKAGTRS